MEARALITQVLVAALVAYMLLGFGLRLVRAQPGRKRVETSRREALYRRLLVAAWCRMAVVPLVCLVSAPLAAADIGWQWPSTGATVYWYAAYVLVLLVLGTMLARWRLQRGRIAPSRSLTLLLPRNATERRLAAAVAVSAGFTEEAVYRGLLIGVGTTIYHMPTAVAAALSLVLFTAGHAYQGPRGMVGVAFMGAIYTGIVVASGSILLAALLHIGQDLLALLVIPAPQQSQPPQPPTSGTVGLEETPSAMVAPRPTTPTPSATAGAAGPPAQSGAVQPQAAPASTVEPVRMVDEPGRPTVRPSVPGAAID